MICIFISCRKQSGIIVNKIYSYMYRKAYQSNVKTNWIFHTFEHKIVFHVIATKYEQNKHLNVSNTCSEKIKRKERWRKRKEWWQRNKKPPIAQMTWEIFNFHKPCICIIKNHFRFLTSIKQLSKILSKSNYCDQKLFTFQKEHFP